MVIGEKLKVNGIAKSTKEAIAIMSMGQKIGTDTKKLTEKKKQEWAETFMKKNETITQIKSEIEQKQKEYDKKIQQIMKQNLDKTEENEQIRQIETQRRTDPELNQLKNNVDNVQVKLFEKLDKYSEYKYKG